MKSIVDRNGSGQAIPILAYLLSQYPAINHAFMLREVRRLRTLGFDIRCVSIREPDRDDLRLTGEELQEKQATFYVKAQPLSAVLAAHARTVVSWPLGYLRGFKLALGMRGVNVSAIVRVLLYFAEAVVVGDWMRRNGVEHVHTHYASNVAWIAKHIFPITMSATFHGPDEFKDPRGFHLGEKVNDSLFVSAISNYGRSQMMLSCQHSQWQKLEITRLGVDTDVLHPQVFRDRSQPFELLCAGRMTAVKGQHVLLEAMQLLKARRCPVRLHLAGDGEDRIALQEHVSAAGLGDSVVFHGFLNQDELRKLYASTDVFVLPSFAEGVPVVLMEAMALGIPCITTWVNGIPELIRNGIDGLTVAPGDTAALANAIATCLGDRRLRQQLSLSARERAVELADLNRNVQHLATVFRRYLGKENVLDNYAARAESANRESAVELPR
jgi:glycosyltransferase involved in cell wall biosynthesis